MSTHSLPDRPAHVKPRTRPHPFVVMYQILERACQDHDARVAQRLVAMCRTLEGRE